MVATGETGGRWLMTCNRTLKEREGIVVEL